MEKKNTAFSEETSKAILDMLVRNSAQIAVMQEQISMLMTIILQNKSEQVDAGTKVRFEYYATRLREAIFANYGELDIRDLLGE